MKTVLKIFAVLTAVLSALFAVYYFNLDMRLMRSVVLPFLNRHYDSVKREHHYLRERERHMQKNRNIVPRELSDPGKRPTWKRTYTTALPIISASVPYAAMWTRPTCTLCGQRRG